MLFIQFTLEVLEIIQMHRDSTNRNIRKRGVAGELERLTDAVLLYKLRYEVMQKTVSKLLERAFCKHNALW